MRAIALGVAVALIFLSTANGQGVVHSEAEVECSRQADEQGLHGAERKEFRTQCKAAAGQSAQSAVPKQVQKPAIEPGQVSQKEIDEDNQVNGAYYSRLRASCKDELEKAKVPAAEEEFRYQQCYKRKRAEPASDRPKTILGGNPPAPRGKSFALSECNRAADIQDLQGADRETYISQCMANFAKRTQPPATSQPTPTTPVQPEIPARLRTLVGKPNVPASEEIPAGSPKEVLEASWNMRSLFHFPIGQMAVVAGPASGNQEFVCGSGSIGPVMLKEIKVAQTLGLLSAVEDAPSQQYNQGQSFSWGQMLDQTTAGVQARITVTPTPLGRSLDVTNSLPPALRLRNCIRMREGVFRITQVVKEEAQRKGVTDYKVLFVNYSVAWNPQYKQFMQMFGQPLSENRKAIALLKSDPFSSKWIYVAADVADADKDFTTANVANALAVAK
jgi:hypothetical protein